MSSLCNLFLDRSLLMAVALSGLLLITGCSSESTPEKASTTQPTEATAVVAETTPAASDKGIGPVSKVELVSTPNQAMVDQGKAIFESKCTACHKFGERYVGPDLAGVTGRRKPEWIMNMILNPQEMQQKDPTAHELLAQFMTQMPNQDLTQEEARAVLEYFRTK